MSSDDDFMPISLLRKKSPKAPASANARDAADFEQPSKRNVKKATSFAASSDSDSDSVPLVQLKKKAQDSAAAKRRSSSSSTTIKTKPAAAAGVKRKAPAAAAKTTSSSNRATKAARTASASSVRTSTTTTSTSTSTVRIKRESSAAAAAVRKLKVHSKTERLDMAVKAYRWWNAEELPEGIQWRSLEHNGVLFPPPYIPHHVPLQYDGVDVALTPLQEEIASFYAAIPKDGPQLGGSDKIANTFNKNFFAGFKAALGKNHAIRRFDKCNFDKIATYLEIQRDERKNMTKDAKLPEKERKELEVATNGIALVDAHVEKVGNFRIEPPGLFRGRGEHPKTGTLKERVCPEDVTVNVGISDRVPICNVPGHAWKEVIHRDTVSWLAYWNENVMNGIKYVWLAASSSFKGKADMAKYEKARRLKKCIDKIRKDYVSGLQASDAATRQRSTAMWVIDVLALRVGNEKGEDEADTVGCCSLRVEHLSFADAAGVCALTLSFLGKDSMPYNNTVALATYGDVGKRVFANLQAFCRKKKPQQNVFDELSVSELNKHLSSLMPGLSAKVFRTFNASVTLEKELPHVIDDKNHDTAQKVILYNDANRKVAILCNHQRTVSKAMDSSLEKMAALVTQLEEQVNELNDMAQAIASGKTKRIQLKSGDVVKEESADKEKDAERKRAEAHRFPKIPTAEQVEKRLDAWKKKAQTLALRLQDKNDNKEVALGTSKINYMDPRITVAWSKRNEVPISAVFSKTLREKFVWAMDVDPEWKF